MRKTYDNLDKLTQEIMPDGEVINYTYDSGGNLIAMTGDIIYVNNVNYNATGKIRSMTYGNGITTDYKYYDTPGDIDAGSGTDLSYLLKSITTDSDVLKLAYRYDVVGNITQKKDLLSEDNTVNYEYDALSRLVMASSGNYDPKTYNYNTIDMITLKDGKNYEYDPTRPYILQSDGCFTYTHDANGNITGRSDNRQMSYDYENRLVSVTDTENPETTVPVISASGYITPDIPENVLDNNPDTYWSADGDGQWLQFDLGRKQKIQSLDIGFRLGADIINYFSIDISQDANSWIPVYTGQSSGNTPELERFDFIDTIGRFVRISGHGNSIDQSNAYYEVKIQALTIPSVNTTYKYDADGQRIIKKENNLVTLYFFPGYEEEYDTNDGGYIDVVKNYYFNNQLLSRRSSRTGTYFYHTDHLGSTVKMTDMNGYPIYAAAYDPWGKLVSRTAGQATNHLFTGQIYDESTSLCYYNARYYDPSLGMFLQPDTMLGGGLNRYSYCGNNPVINIDPSGHDFWSSVSYGLLALGINFLYQTDAILHHGQDGYNYMALFGNAVLGGIYATVAEETGGSWMCGYSEAGPCFGIAWHMENSITYADRGNGGNMGIGGGAGDAAVSITKYEDMLKKEAPFSYTDYLAMMELAGQYEYPVGSKWMTSDFGWRVLNGKRSYHTGVDWGRAEGTPLYAPRDGRVTTSEWDKAYGNKVIIEHTEAISPHNFPSMFSDAGKNPYCSRLTIQTNYYHLIKSFVHAGQYVYKGQKIGLVGDTGEQSFGAHLHFSVQCSGWWINPFLLLR